ncbi:MAG: hypothetical protein ACRYGK_06045 [Janthinobacterium lividum]
MPPDAGLTFLVPRGAYCGHEPHYRTGSISPYSANSAYSAYSAYSTNSESRFSLASRFINDARPGCGDTAAHP